jgi:hypothetical protein
MQGFWKHIVGLVCSLGLLGCYGEQEVVDYCAGDPSQCTPCHSSEQCVIVSNACHETASCVHRDVGLAVTQEGCNYGYDVPSDSVCECVQNVCSSDGPVQP